MFFIFLFFSFKDWLAQNEMCIGLLSTGACVCFPVDYKSSVSSRGIVVVVVLGMKNIPLVTPFKKVIASG